MTRSPLLALCLLFALVSCSDDSAPVDSPGRQKSVDIVVTDPTALLILDEEAGLDARLDAIDGVGPDAPHQVLDALLRVMKDRSQLAFITVRDESDLGYHVEESPYGGVDTRAELRWSAIIAVEKLGLVEALPDLLAALHDRHGVVRNHAARALWKLGYATGLPVLVKALEARAFENETANRILEEISGEDLGFDTDAGWVRKSEAIARWRAWIEKDPAPPTKRTGFGEDEELDRRGRFLVAMLGQHQFLFMEQARRTLIELGPLGVHYIESVLDDPELGANTTLRAYSVQVLRDVANDAARARLRRMLADGDEDVAARARAADALGAIADRDAAGPLGEALSARDESLVIASARALGLIAVESATPALEGKLADERASARLRRTAAISLLRIGSSAAAREHILDRLENGPLHERADLIEMLEEWKGATHGYDPNEPGSEQPAAISAWRTALK